MAPTPFHPAEPSLFRSTMTVASTSSLASSSIREHATQRAVASSSQQLMGQQPQVHDEFNPFHDATQSHGGGGRGHNGHPGEAFAPSPPPSTIVVGAPSPSLNWNTPMMAGGLPSTTARHDSDVSRPHGPPPALTTPPVPSAPSSSAATTAADARREWNLHGTGRTQLLQDQADLAAASRGQVMARVVSHAPRADVAGSPYTAYILSVTGPAVHPSAASAAPGASAASAGSVAAWQVERRYSDFHKLHAHLQRSCSPVTAAHLSRFPSKHWSSTKLLRGWSATTDADRQLVEDRAIQLDIWLVQVLTLYNRGSLDDGSRRAVYDFLCASGPPCDRDNATAATTTTSTDAADAATASSHSAGDQRDGAYDPPTHRPQHATTRAGPEERIKYHNPWTTTVGSSLRQAVQTIEQLTSSHVDSSIPLDLLQSAHGLLFLTVVKGGMVFSGRVGTGILVARRDDQQYASSYFESLHRRVGSLPAPPSRPPPGGEWSAPCAISVLGMGWGALVGGDVTHYLVVLTSRKATMDLVSSTRLQLGAELGVAVGPVGRGANSHLQTGDWTVHPAYAYAISHGLFVGMSLEGSVLRVRDDVNALFYGRPVSATQILHHPPVKAAEPLYRAIGRATRAEIPPGAFRPSEYFFSKGASSSSSSRGVNQASSYGDSHYLYNSIQPHVAYQNPSASSQSVPSQGYPTPSPSWASASQWGT